MLRAVDSFVQVTCLSANAFFIFPKKLPWIKNPHLQLPTIPGRRLSMKRHMKSPLVEADKKSSETSFELTEMGLFQDENSSTKLHLDHFCWKEMKDETLVSALPVCFVNPGSRVFATKRQLQKSNRGSRCRPWCHLSPSWWMEAPGLQNMDVGCKKS